MESTDDLGPSARWVIQTHPAVLEDYQVRHYVADLHTRQEDFSEGDLFKRIDRFDRFVLKPISLSQLNLDEWNVDDIQAQEYADMPGPLPPIVYDATRKSIIDGIHRVSAAMKRGETMIEAYVGLPENLASRRLAAARKARRQQS